MNYSFELQEMKPFLVFDLKEKVIITILIITTLSIGILIQKQIYKFIQRRKERLINKIIISHMMVLNLCHPIWLIVTLLISLIEGIFINDFIFLNIPKVC